jgi:hypothetical protein
MPCEDKDDHVDWLEQRVSTLERELAAARDLYGARANEVERLRRFPSVWAVRYGNYDPSEVITLYDNEQAARAHATMSDDPLEVEEMEVRSTPPQLSGGPLETEPRTQ